MPKQEDKIIDALSTDIADTVGNMHEDELEVISKEFDKTMKDALSSFNSNTFDDDGFIKRMRDLSTDNKSDKDMVNNVLSTVGKDYISAESLHQNELLLRRDIKNICAQLPEMHDVINIIRDSIIECSVATGEVSRTLIFENHSGNEVYESKAKEIEKTYNLPMAIKNFIVPRGLESGEMYIQVTPYKKLFAELELAKERKSGHINYNGEVFKESIPYKVANSFQESHSIYSKENLDILMESASSNVKSDIIDDYKTENGNGKTMKISDAITKEDITCLLESIEISNGSSVMMTEMGEEGFESFVYMEYNDYLKKTQSSISRDNHFMEAMGDIISINNDELDELDIAAVTTQKYNDIKGAYVKYLSPLRLVPIRMDRRVIGYYYVTSTMDLQRNSLQKNGTIDVSYQHFTKDKKMVDQLASIIIRSFDKKMLEKNIKLKNEIVEIIMAHKFSEGKLSFIYIPENEVVRLVINEDEDGKGHSTLEPSIFPARITLMLTMYNTLYILNNNQTRIHYIKSSGLNKDYASQIQRTIRKFQSRRISVDDIYSYSGVLNKVGAMSEMVLPAGRNDYKALETDTIEASNAPINTEFLEQNRKQMLSGTGVPALMSINALDEVDFAKSLELANTRFLSTISSYKIDFNNGITDLYQRLMRYTTDIEEEVIRSFKFKFNAAKQQELTITSEMIQNFNSLVELVMSVYYSKSDMEDEKGNASQKQIHLRKELAKEYLPQLNFDRLDEIVKQVEVDANDDILQSKVTQISIDQNDIDEITSK